MDYNRREYVTIRVVEALLPKNLALRPKHMFCKFPIIPVQLQCKGHTYIFMPKSKQNKFDIICNANILANKTNIGFKYFLRKSWGRRASPTCNHKQEFPENHFFPHNIADCGYRLGVFAGTRANFWNPLPSGKEIKYSNVMTSLNPAVGLQSFWFLDYLYKFS